MRVEVIPSVEEIKAEEIVSKTVIVIDTLRATSSIVTALAQGAKEVIPVETIGQAKLQLEANPEYFLAGERKGKTIPDFDLANSPTELQKVSLANKGIILTTTNGTRAILKAWKSPKILIGSFLNGSYCAATAIAEKADITILCSGSRSHFSLEDGLAAGYLLTMMQQMSSIRLNDLGWTVLYAYQATENHLTDVIAQGETGRMLIESGMKEDVMFCCQRDLYPLAGEVAHSSSSVVLKKKTLG